MDNLAVPIPPIPFQPAVSSLPAQAQAKADPAEFSNHHWFLWLAGGLALLVLGVAIGVFGAKFLGQSQNQPQLTPTPTPTLSPTPTPTPDPTAGWKTYINTEYNYSIKYPNKIDISEEVYYINFLLPNESTSQNGYTPKMSVAYFDNPDSLSAKDLFYQLSAKSEGPNTPKTKMKDLIINGHNAFQYLSFAGDGEMLVTWLTKAKVAIKISYNYGENQNYPNNEEHGKLFDQILSTFHFLK